MAGLDLAVPLCLVAGLEFAVRMALSFCGAAEGGEVAVDSATGVVTEPRPTKNAAVMATIAATSLAIDRQCIGKLTRCVGAGQIDRERGSGFSHSQTVPDFG
jgi:hypothetical protein